MFDRLRDMWEHRDDGYWWADHQLELAILVALAAGSIGLMFKWAELAIEAHYQPGVPDA